MPGFNWPADKPRDEDDRETFTAIEFLSRATLEPGPPAVAQPNQNPIGEKAIISALSTKATQGPLTADDLRKAHEQVKGHRLKS